MFGNNKGGSYLVIFIILVLIIGGGIWVAKEKGLIKSAQEVINDGQGMLDESNEFIESDRIDEYSEESGEAKYQESLSLVITNPTDGTTVPSANLNVTGKTASGAEVFVNDKETKAEINGNFSVNITIDEGENIIVVIANDLEGNYIEKEIKVTY
jgi:hypothetical protein